MYRSFCLLLFVLFSIIPSAAMTPAEERALLEDMRALRETVQRQEARIMELEARSDRPVSSEEEAPSPELAGTGEPTGIPMITGRTGIQPKFGAIFDGVYTGGKNVADNADFRGVELQIGAPIDPNFDLYADIAFTPTEVAIEEGYVTGHLPWNFQARMGRELVPFGDLNRLHLHDQPQVDDPHVMNQFFGGEGLNAIGGHIEWLAPFTTNPTLELSFGAYNRAQGDANTAATDRDGDGTADSADMFLDEGVFNVSTRERGPLLSGRISSFFDWDESRHALRVGGSLLDDANDASGATRTQVIGVDAKYRWTPDATGRGVVIAGEYLAHHRRENPTTLFWANGGNNLRNNGAYVYGQYDFNNRWSLGYRYDVTNTRFSDFNEIQANSIYGEWRPSEFSRLRAQYRHDDRNFDATGNGVLTDDDADVFMLQFTHLIGWHPAHKF